MKKVLVHKRVITVQQVGASPEYWSKDGESRASQPMLEDGVTPDSSWTHHPAVAEVPEQSEPGELVRDFIAADQATAESMAAELPHDLICVIQDPPYEYLLADCRSKRAAAYPSAGDVLDAIFKKEAGDPTEFNSIASTRAAVKAQYPKPVAP